MTDPASDSARGAQLDHRAELNLVPHRGAPREAREFLTSCCTAWNAGRYLDVGGLVLSELVTNAVRHAGTEFQVGVMLGEGELTLTVADHDARIPYVVPRQERAVGGQGMAIVSGLVAEWGVQHLAGGGKLVWCRIPDPTRDRVPGPATPEDHAPDPASAHRQAAVKDLPAR